MTKDMTKIQDFLQSPGILTQIIKDMDTLGCVGEEENKLLGYLISLSRKLSEPISGIAVSSSGAGKSRLVETVEALTPPEEVVFTSKLTPQALYYMPKDFLKHKLLIIEERAGSELADYAVRTLQSKGKLTLATPIKNQTVFFEVKGPVSTLETTTNRRLNHENVSRSFLLHLDESSLQTGRIHRYQRFLKTKRGIELKEKVSRIRSFHHSFQRLLKGVHILIPCAERLTFPVNSTFLRRDNQKFLTLIETVTFLYQYQRKRVSMNGVTYIESTPKDYEIAHSIFKKTYKSPLLFARPKAGILFNQILGIKKEFFTKRDIVSRTGWPDYAVRDNIRALEEAGLVRVIQKHKGKESLYALDNRLELTDPKELEERPSSTT